MKVTHILGHNSKWNIDAYNEQEIGDHFLISAYTFGTGLETNKKTQSVKEISMLDLQFYAKKEGGGITGGKLKTFDFHPSNHNGDDQTNVYFENCAKQGILYQVEQGFTNIIVPNFYDNDTVESIVYTIKTLNKYLAKTKLNDRKYYMTLVFAKHIIIDESKVEEILFACTDMSIVFDGYFIVAENEFGFKEKVNKEIKVIKNLSKVFKTLKQQGFQTIYGYANWDAILYLAQTNIDYITIGTYENLRKFDIKRFTQDASGGASKGYYFSEKLLNMVRADDITLLREMGNLEYIANDKNIFSNIVLNENYVWNSHKPDVNKNYLLSISSLLNRIDSIKDLNERIEFVKKMIDNAISIYSHLGNNNVYLSSESENYHLNFWKTYLSNL